MSLSKQVNDYSGDGLPGDSKLAISLLRLMMKSIWQKPEFVDIRPARVKS